MPRQDLTAKEELEAQELLVFATELNADFRVQLSRGRAPEAFGRMTELYFVLGQIYEYWPEQAENLVAVVADKNASTFFETFVSRRGAGLLNEVDDE